MCTGAKGKDSCYDFYAFLREYRGNTIIVVMNNSREPASRSLMIDVQARTDLPGRIKENLKRRKELKNVFNRSEVIVCRDDGKLAFQVSYKEAKNF